MNKKKILKITGIVFVSFLALLVILPYVFRGKIVQKIKDTANESLTATLNFDESISLSLIKNFPNIHLSIKDLSIIGKDSFENDTLIYTPLFSTTINLKSFLFGDQMQINRILLSEPVVRLLVLPSGKANWDITIPDSLQEEEADSSSPFSLHIEELAITKADIYYDDGELDFNTHLLNLNHTLKGKFTDQLVSLSTVSDIEKVSAKFEDIPLLSNAKSTINADLDLDLNTFRFTLKENTMTLNALQLFADGFVQMNDLDMDFDLDFGIKESDFKNFLSLIPVIYSKDFDKLKASGKLAFEGNMKGKMTETTMPSYLFSLKAENGFFKYPDLPTSLEKFFLDLNIENKTGEDKDLVVDLKNMSFNVDNNPFAANLYLVNPEKASMKGALNGKIDLGVLHKLVDMQDMKIDGKLETALDFSGKMANIEAGNYESIDANGMLKLTDFSYSDAETPIPYELQNFLLNFNTQKITMESCVGKIGKTDFNAKGSLSNFFSYMLSDGTLKGDLQLNSNYVDANQFMTESETTNATTSEDTSSVGSIEIPANIDFEMGVNINKLRYDNLDIENMKGNVAVKESKLIFNDVALQVLGGSMGLDGVFDGQNPKMPFTDIAFNMQNFDIPKAFSSFEMFQKLAPIAKFATGMFAMSLDLKSNFDEQMNMQYPTMSGEGMLSLSNTSLQNLKLMEVLADRFKLDKFKNLNLKDQKIKFAISDGKINTDSISMKLWDNTNLKLTGFSTLNQELNYNGILSIPRKDLGQSNQGLNTLLSQAQGKGLNINVDEMVNVGIKIGGTFTKPTVSLDLKQSASNLVNSMVDQAKDQLKQKATETVANTKEEVKKEAREKADKILADAQIQADRIKSEAKKQADKVRNEGKNAANIIREQTDKQAAEVRASATNQVAKLAADKAAKKITDEGYAKAQKLENEANIKADSIENEANKRADKIMGDARTKANETLK